MYIAFEGPEGGGKGTMVRILVDFLRELGYNVTVTREPGSTQVGEKIRRILLHDKKVELDAVTEFLLFSASRAALMHQVISPALQARNIVISDRTFHSSQAYQGYGRGLSLSEITCISHFAVGGCVPDLVLLLDLPVEVGLARKVNQDEMNRMEAEEIKFHERLRTGYLELAAADPDTWVVVDATQPLEKVFADVRSEVLRALGKQQNLELM